MFSSRKTLRASASHVSPERPPLPSCSEEESPHIHGAIFSLHVLWENLGSGSWTGLTLHFVPPGAGESPTVKSET